MILITVYPVYVMINGKKFVQTYSTNSINSQNTIDHCIPSVCYDKWEKFVQKYFTKSINSQNSTKRQKLTISQKSQNDSSLQNSTNVKYAPNYKNMQYS